MKTPFQSSSVPSDLLEAAISGDRDSRLVAEDYFLEQGISINQDVWELISLERKAEALYPGIDFLDADWPAITEFENPADLIVHLSCCQKDLGINEMIRSVGCLLDIALEIREPLFHSIWVSLIGVWTKHKKESLVQYSRLLHSHEDIYLLRSLSESLSYLDADQMLDHVMISLIDQESRTLAELRTDDLRKAGWIWQTGGHTCLVKNLPRKESSK